MPTKRHHREALATLGLAPVDYFIDGWPPTWGTAYQRDGEDVFVIESHGCHTDDDALRNRFMLKRGRGVLHKPLGVYKLKRQALAAMAARWL
jgi:hypothetical protein